MVKVLWSKPAHTASCSLVAGAPGPGCVLGAAAPRRTLARQVRGGGGGVHLLLSPGLDLCEGTWNGQAPKPGRRVIPPGALGELVEAGWAERGCKEPGSHGGDLWAARGLSLR